MKVSKFNFALLAYNGVCAGIYATLATASFIENDIGAAIWSAGFFVFFSVFFLWTAWFISQSLKYAAAVERSDAINAVLSYDLDDAAEYCKTVVNDLSQPMRIFPWSKGK